MHASLADQQIEATDADFESDDEWLRTQQFIYNALDVVRDLLPALARKCLHKRGISLPPESALVDLRAALRQSIDSDSSGNTPAGAVIRAVLFAFHHPMPESPAETIHLFARFYCLAGVPEAPLVAAFRRQGPHRDD